MIKYSEIIETLNDRLLVVKSTLKKLVFLRLLVFMLIFTPWFFLSSLSVSNRVIISFVFVVFFFVLIKKNKKVADQKEYLLKLIAINVNEIQCVNKDYSANESGKNFIVDDHSYSNDLDVFGNGSLYQYITRAATNEGKKTLANWLSTPNLSIEKLVSRQQAIEELNQQVSWRQELQASGQLSEEQPGDVDDVIDWVKKPDNFKIYLWHKIMLILVPVYAVVVTFLLSVDLISGQEFTMYIFAPLIITGIYFKKTQESYKKLNKGFKSVAKFGLIFKKIEENNFESELLRTIKKNSAGASEALNELNSIIGAFDQRMNLLVAFFMNMYLAWDLRCMVNLAKWRLKYAGETKHWFESLGTLEALSSFGNYRYNHIDETVFPSFNNTGDVEGVGLGHPFLPKKDRVDNDFKVSYKNFAIITGANMAGKSTFLRTLGINIVLANAGGSVIAKSFSLKPIQIYSSMRTSDSLQKNESYFYTELKRLHGLVNLLANGEQLFIILDEILKGTNSKDKAEGSYKFIKKILQLDAMGVIATHDLSLCEIEKEFPSRVNNLFFDVSILGDDLSFDYLLRDGICSNMNATFLMQKMGITD